MGSSAYCSVVHLTGTPLKGFQLWLAENGKQISDTFEPDADGADVDEELQRQGLEVRFPTLLIAEAVNTSILQGVFTLSADLEGNVKG